MIKNIVEVKNYFFTALETNGNRLVREEINPWESGTLYIFRDRLLITSEQMKDLKPYLFQIRPNKEAEFCYFSTGNHSKDQVIWEGSEHYQSHLTHNRKNEAREIELNLIEEKIKEEIRELKLAMNLGKFSSFFSSKSKGKKNNFEPYPKEVIIRKESIPRYEGDADQGRIVYLLNLLEEQGVHVLDSRLQPDGVTTIYLDRPVKIPNFLLKFLELKSVDGIQPSECGNSDLVPFPVVSLDYTMISPSDENFYYRKKLGY